MLLHHNSTEIDERSPPIKLSGEGVEWGAYKLPTTCHGLIVTPILNRVEYLDCESLIGNAKVFVIPPAMPNPGQPTISISNPLRGCFSGRARVPARREDLPPHSGVFSSAIKTRPRFRSQRIARTRSLPATLPHSACRLADVARDSRKPVRRSLCSMLPTARSRPRKRGALHNQALAKSEGRRRGRERSAFSGLL